MFDCVDHGLLLKKLRLMGVGNIDWFRSYLSDRRQCVVVNGAQSDFRGISCGVPQGSILGPILFLCYVNDMACSLKCRLSLYADDSALVAAGRSVKDLSSFLSSELETCKKWMVDNRLSLHVGKTESIIFGSSRMLNNAGGFSVSCNGTAVGRSSTVKYLGVILDEKLSGDTHALKVVGKISARLSFLYRKSSMLDMSSRKTLCLALVQPLFDYCCTAWHEGLSAKLKDRFDVMQRKMVRFVFNMSPRGHVDQQSLKQLGWLSVRDRVRYFRLIHVFKISKGLAPDYLVGGFTPVASVHGHNTRGSMSDYHISKESRTALKCSSFGVTAKREWNSLPRELKLLPNIGLFKSRLRKYFLEQY